MVGQLLSARFICSSSIIMLLLSFMVGCEQNSNVIPATNQFEATSDTILLKKDHLYEGNKTNTLVEMIQFEVDVPLDNHNLTIPSDFIALLHLSPDKEQEEIK